MSIIFDIIIVLFIVASIYMGYKRGIVDVGFKLFAIVVSIVVSLVFYSPITHFVVDNTELDEKLVEIIVEKGSAREEKAEEKSGDSIDAYVENYAKDVAKGTQNTVVEASARPIAVNIIGIGVMLCLFIGIRIVLSILKTFTNIITKLPLIKQCNEFVGLLYGIIRGLAIVYIILAITYFITSMTGPVWINDVINNSFVTKFFYDNNVIMMLV